MHDGRIDDYLAGKKLLRATDLQNKATDEADHNSKSIAALLHYFRQVRMNFIEKLEQLDDQMLNAVSVHPRLQQPMNLVDMVSFVCEHDDHHLAKMRLFTKISCLAIELIFPASCLVAGIGDLGNMPSIIAPV